MLLNGKILPILSCFLLLFDENKVLVSVKNDSGQKYIKLADIATLTQLDGILTLPLTSEVVQNR